MPPLRSADTSSHGSVRSSTGQQEAASRSLVASPTTGDSAWITRRDIELRLPRPPKFPESRRTREGGPRPCPVHGRRPNGASRRSVRYAVVMMVPATSSGTA
jgi:hypothetical protein